MADDDIVTKVDLEGADEAAAKLEKLGDVGAESFDKIGESAQRASGPIAAVEAAAKKTGVTIQGTQAATAAFATELRGTGAAAGIAGAAAAGAAKDVKVAGGAASAAAIDFRGLAQTLRVLGRTTHIPGLSVLSSQMRLIGRLGAIAVPILLIVGLEQLASSAAAAATKVGDLALQANTSTDEFQNIAQAGAGAGVGIDKMGTAITGVNKMFKEASENATKNAERINQLKDTLHQLEQQSIQLSQRYRELELQGVKSFEHQKDAAISFLRASRGLTDDLTKLERDKARFAKTNFADAEAQAQAREELDQRELELSEKQIDLAEKRRREVRDLADADKKRKEELAQLIDQEEQNEKKIRETRKALNDAAHEASRSGNAIEKLGVNFLDANGKARKLNEEGLKDLADAFKRFPEGPGKVALAAELVEAGIDRAMLPALKRGRQGVEEFIAEGKKIAPGFNEAQIEIGDEFTKSVGKFGLALKNLKDQAGINVAPGFTKFFEDMTTRIGKAIPFVQQISKGLGFLIGLTGKLTLQPSPIIGGFQLIKAAIDDLNLKWSDIPKFAKAAWEQIKKSASEAWDFVKAKFKEGVDFVKSLIPDDPLKAIWELIKLGADKAWEFIKKKFNEGIEKLKSLIPDDPLQVIWDLIKAGAGKVWDFLVRKFKEGVTKLQELLPEDPLQAIWDLIKEGAGKLWDFLVAKFKEGADAAWKFMKDAATDAMSWVGQKIDDGIGKLREMWQWVKDVAKGFAGLFGGGGGAPIELTTTKEFQGLAGGGRVRGRGTSTSDSILAWLSNEEFVVKAAAVRKYGANFLEQLNSMRLPVNGFALGGLADGMQVRNFSRAILPGFAQGGLVQQASGRTLVLNIGSESFNLQTRDDETAERVTRFAMRRQLRSAGRKPSAWG